MDKNLPKNWITTSIEEICTHPQYGYTTKAVSKGNIRLLRTTDITSGKIDWSTVPYCKDNPQDPEKYLLRERDIVISRAGSVGVSYLIQKPDNSVFASYLIRFNPLIDRKFFKCFLESPFYWSSISEKKLGIAIPNLNATKIKSIKFNLPPLPEQRAIVSKLEQLFSDLDNSIESFKKAQMQLKIYRQAVLKKAFEGELTKKWREKQTDLPSAEELLQQIKEERERHYQKQQDEWKLAVKDWEGGGKEGKKPTKPKTMTELPPLTENELKKLPKLSEMWGYIKFGNIYSYSPKNGLYKPSHLYGSGTQIIRIDDFYDGKLIRYKNFKSVKLTKDEAEAYSLKEGQILVNRVNSIDYLGKCGLVEKMDFDVVFESNIMKISILDKIVLPKYITYFLSSYLGTKEIRKNAKHAVNQASINQNDVSITNIPFCNLQEQHQIISEIERRLSVCDKMEATITESLKKAESLRQSILKKAFEGKLLNEKELEEARAAPDWEPAGKLLERIKAEKINTQTKKKGKK